MNIQSDISLVTLTRQGDQTAFRHLVEMYQRPIYSLCYRMLGDAGAAEDAAQEVFIRAYYKLEWYDQERKFSTWLYAIASHYCLDQLKLKRRRLQPVSLEALPGWQRISGQPQVQPERLLLQAETTSEVQNLLASLRPAYRLPVILKYWHDMSCEEIAQTLDTSVSAIKSKLFRARKTMAQALKQQAASDPASNPVQASFGQLAVAGGYLCSS